MSICLMLKETLHYKKKLMQAINSNNHLYNNKIMSLKVQFKKISNHKILIIVLLGNYNNSNNRINNNNNNNHNYNRIQLKKGISHSL